MTNKDFDIGDFNVDFLSYFKDLFKTVVSKLAKGR